MSSNSILQQVIQALPSLSHQDIATLQLHLKLLSPTKESEDDPLYLAYIQFKRKQGQTVMPLVALKKTRYYSRFKKGVEAVEEFATQLHLRKVQRWKVLMFLAEICCDFLVEHDKPVNINTFSWAMTIIEEIVDRAFPGYAACGLLQSIVDGRVSQ